MYKQVIHLLQKNTRYPAIDIHPQPLPQVDRLLWIVVKHGTIVEYVDGLEELRSFDDERYLYYEQMEARVQYIYEVFQ